MALTRQEPSPLAWGKLHTSTKFHVDHRAIPTGVGKTLDKTWIFCSKTHFSGVKYIHFTLTVLPCSHRLHS